MLALAFSFSIFLLWTVVGRALLALVSPRFGALRSWLLAPGLGLAIVLFSLMVGNQAGWPIGSFARSMTLGWTVAALAVLLWRKPPTAWRALAPFFGAALFSLLWTGWPALRFGFNWISYGNDDMANYCLAAERFASHGFFAVPTMAELMGRDYSSYYFFMHVADMMRFGAEHLVAWTACLAGLKTTEGFMPVILALALAQLFGAAGLALRSGRNRRRALVAAWILAVSPLFMLGTLYQLIAQVGGIALLLVTLALLTRTWGTARRRDVLRYAIAPAVAGTGFCLCYPEPTPFLVVTYFGCIGLALFRRRLAPAVAVALLAYTSLGIVLLLHYNLISFVSTLVMQLTSAMSSANLLLSLFPYFLLPTGFSDFYGWMPIAHDFPEPVVSLSIAAGMGLSVVLLWRAVREAWQLRADALLLLVQAAVAVKFYLGASDFTLYKLVMYMQPVLAIALAGLVLRLRSGRRVFAAVALFGLTTTPTALYYTRSSEGAVSGGLTELRYGSRLGMHIAPPANPDAQITATIENVVAAKFAASELRGHPLALLSRDYFYPNTRIDFRHPPLPVLFHPHFADMAQARPLMIERNNEYMITSTLWRTEFSQPALANGTDYYLSLAHQLSLFNKFGHDPAEPVRAVFDLTPTTAVRNQLIFVHSGRGNHYYLGNRAFISFFQQESDPFAPGRDFNGLGHFMLLRVEHPTDQIYLRIAATRTQLPGRTAWKPSGIDGQGHLTGPVVNAASDLPLGAVGNGAFNLFVGPLRPRMFQGAAYVAIDYDEPAKTILDRRIGLKNLYNNEVPLDYRRLLGWGRDVSALSVDEYRQLQRPLRVSSFPRDLATAETLEFSGAYEDGWLSPTSKFVLGAGGSGGCLRVRGFVPELPGTPLGQGTLRLGIDGHETELPAATGVFDWLVPLPAPADTTCVALRFSATTVLPGADRRPIGGKLELLEVLPALPAHTFDYGTPGAVRLAATGIDQDGWMMRHATIEMPAAAAATELTLRFEYPDWSGGKETVLHADLGDASTTTAQTLAPGQYTAMHFRAPASATPRTLRLELPGEFPLSPTDPRRRAARLLELHLAPAPDA